MRKKFSGSAKSGIDPFIAYNAVVISVTARIFSADETFRQASRSARFIASRLVNRVRVLSTGEL